MINSVHRFLLLIPNPNFLLYSCNSSVSYTHLDVYKRQMPDGLKLGSSQRAASLAHAVGDGFQRFFRGADNQRPVSYTHLFSFTVISSAPSTTWLFVTIYPSLEMMTPAPKPTRGWVCIWRWRPRPSPKKKSKISGCSCTVWVLLNWVARICTTAWRELSAACVKSTGWASVAWKAAGSRLLGFCAGALKAVYKPVSYTHLDVYKRQVLLCPKNTAFMRKKHQA